MCGKNHHIHDLDNNFLIHVSCPKHRITINLIGFGIIDFPAGDVMKALV